MIFAWPAERSTYHTTCVNRVKSHLKRICADAGKERGFVPGRITDAYGYDKITKTLFFCEIKVNPNDLLKAITQLHITTSNYKPNNPETKIIPVIAIPKKLALGLAKYKPLDWKSFRSLCMTNHTALWIIEQSNIRQIQGPKPQAPKKKTKKVSTKPRKSPKRKITKKAKSIRVRKASITTKLKKKTKTNSKNIKKRKPTIKKRGTARRKSSKNKKR